MIAPNQRVAMRGTRTGNVGSLCSLRKKTGLGDLYSPLGRPWSALTLEIAWWVPKAPDYFVYDIYLRKQDQQTLLKQKSCRQALIINKISILILVLQSFLLLGFFSIDYLAGASAFLQKFPHFSNSIPIIQMKKANQ